MKPHTHVFDTDKGAFLDSQNGIRLWCLHHGCLASSDRASGITITHLVDDELGRLYLEVDYRHYADVFLNGHKVTELSA